MRILAAATLSLALGCGGIVVIDAVADQPVDAAADGADTGLCAFFGQLCSPEIPCCKATTCTCKPGRCICLTEQQP